MQELVLVRHGETTGDSRVRLNGATDVPLSELGRRQMRAAARAIRDLEVRRLLVSPLTRSKQAGALVVPALADAAEEIEGFREVDFGAWETWTWEEVRARDPEGYAALEAAGDQRRYPGGDSIPAFRARIAATARALEVTDGVTVAALHKGVIKVILATLLGEPMKEWMSRPVELGSLHRLRHTGAGWELVAAAEVAHLGDDRCPGS